MKRPGGEIKQLPAPPPPAVPAIPTLRLAQNACYEALRLALKEGHVFAALTGPEGSGKTTVLEAVLADRTDRALRCIRISDPDKVPASLADQIEQVAYAEAGKPENLERHIVLAIDDAHTSSHELLLCLSRLAAMREPGRRVPQILMIGRPELWDVLADDEYEVLSRRLAIRAALPAAEEDADPWALIADEVTQTMTQLRAEAERLPAVQQGFEPAYGHEPRFEREYNVGYGQDGLVSDDPNMADVGDVPPPSMFALFPDPPPKAKRSAARETRRRLVMPLVCLFVGLAAFAFALSFYDWPDLIGEMPWSEPKPTTPFVMPRLQAQSFGLPVPPSSESSPPPAAPPATPPKPVAALPKPAAPAPAPRARQVAAASPPERPSIPSVPAEKPAVPAPTVAEAPARPEPTIPPLVPPMIAALPAPVAPTPVVPTPVTPTPLMPTPVMPTAVTPTPVTPTPVPASMPAPAPTIVPATAPVRNAANADAPLSPAMIALLLRRGDEEGAIGDISAARLLYERAAESGSALAARQMGRSFDAAFLPAAVSNTLADIGRAKLWYQRAASLGNTEAATRLQALNQGR